MENSPREKLRDYLFVDIKLLTKFSDQIRAGFQEVSKELSPGANSGIRPDPPPAEPTIHDKIVLVESLLEVQNDLCDRRPIEMEGDCDPQTCRFVKESMMATKVILPLDEACPVDGLSQFAVWVSDPDPAHYVNEDYRWRGTFLYLTEIHWDYAGFSTVFSGVSALQALINQMTGKGFFDYISEEWEPYGRGRDLHPVDKLRELGGIASEQRRIMALYRKRYLTNEQVYSHEGEKRRVNDLLGYPIYIVADD